MVHLSLYQTPVKSDYLVLNPKDFRLRFLLNYCNKCHEQEEESSRGGITESVTNTGTATA